NSQTTASPSWNDELRGIRERSRRESQEEIDKLVRELANPRLTPEERRKKLDEFLERKSAKYGK
ncbi:MAG TPA: hypothetical protein VFY93_12665, partial [Planctomycetota bacterium]|nr:hypothetical protein [Planctomycetota bacterium]